jgi:hypothetical protein
MPLSEHRTPESMVIPSEIAQHSEINSPAIPI